MSKRKASSSDGASSRKKSVSFSDLKGPVKLELQKEVCLPPILASTPGILIPHTVPFDLYKRPVYDSETPSHQPNRSNAHKPHDEFILQSSRHPRIDYIGTEEGADNISSRLNHYVAVYDPSTGSLKIHPTHKLVVRGSVRKVEDDEAADADKAKAKVTFRAQREALGNQFGTTKTKKAITARAVNAIASNEGDGDDAANNQIIDAVSSTAANSLDRTGLQQQVDGAKPRPLPNYAAATPAEVYTPESLMGADNLRTLSIDGWANAIRERQDVITPSRFVSRRLEKLVNALDETDGSRGADPESDIKLLRYMLFLIELYNQLKSRGSSKKAKKWPKMEEFEKMHEGSTDLARKARKQFSENNEVTKWHSDYLATHMAAISLVIDKFETDTYDLRQDLQLDNREMTQYFREIGARVTEPGAVHFSSREEAALHRSAKLRLPLDFPRQRIIPTKKR